MKGRSSIEKVEVRADGTGMTSRAGTSLLAFCAQKLGLVDALAGGLGHLRERRSPHRPGDVLCDVAVMLTDGGRCVSDLTALAGQPALFGEIASVSTARRVLLSLGERELDAIRRARALTRARAWVAGAAPAEVILDFDSTPVTAHSDKERAAGHYKGGYGFHPLLASCGREVLAGVLRPGNAGANDAADHLEVLELALEQLPPAALEGPILARSDSAGASHAFAAACRETGDPLLARLRANRVGPPGHPRPLRGCLETGARRRRRAARRGVGDRADRPGRSVGVAGRHAPDLPARAPTPRRAAVLLRPRRAPLSVLHHRPSGRRSGRLGGPSPRPRRRRRSRAGAQEHGPGQPPVRRLRRQRRLAGARPARPRHHRLDAQLCLDGAHAICEPKRLRYRILHVAGRLTRHARRLTLHLPADWPWKAALIRAFERLNALPALR